MSVKKIGIIYNNEQNCYLANMLSDNNVVRICGSGNNNFNLKKNVIFDSLENTIINSKYIIFSISVPDEVLETIRKKHVDLLKDKIVFSRKMDFLNNKKIILKDYFNDANFKILNGLTTSEAAISIVIKETIKILSKSKCLVIGFGNIGKILSSLLKKLGAEVAVSARKNTDFAWAEAFNYEILNTENLPNLNKFDAIFNTVPKLILNKEKLSSINKNSLIIDLASKPGGTDFEFAKNINLKVIHALRLPGKFSPYTAAEIMKKVILNIIKEENL
ncbi:MAG: dipicolinate synthase subunit DpsA [Candidatus Paraimprobicoccus trichonymphae]|uniref:Dipicolinate synthase subunit DpsA n=1 Tax=Candidatus Paraimprobicoccus trichonymphae TaxID=3033793 RepID=A0AA48KW11_9FIRM|nr:MAG: dipicolinate synthase subunit DpsA [Candidatus Paraimprobicoccus trichonymphae]